MELPARIHAIRRIAEIDAFLDGARAWGSWMVEIANEREGLVDQLRAAGEKMEHRYLARTASGAPTD